MRSSRAGLSRRDQAVARSLDSARLRAESRVQRFLDAASELLDSRPGRDFTVQEVVERSGQSLHSFYQYFGGKHELLLALFEESVRTTTDQLREVIAQEDDPLERLHSLRASSTTACAVPPSRPTGAEAPGSTRDGRVRPAAADRTPEGGGPGLLPARLPVRGGPPGRGRRRRPSDPGSATGPIVGIVLEVIMFNTFSSTIGGMSLRHPTAIRPRTCGT